MLGSVGAAKMLKLLGMGDAIAYPMAYPMEMPLHLHLHL